MAYPRSITARVKLFYQQQHRITPLFSHAHRHDSDGEGFPAKSVSRNFEIGSCIQNRFLGTKSNLSNFQRSSNFVGFGLDFGRSFSRLSVGEGVADGIEFRSDAVEAAAANAAPVVSEVAAAAADSAGPVAAVQYLIDYVHCCTGFNWWASIAVATVLVRCLQIPSYFWELKFRSKLARAKKDLKPLGKTGYTRKEFRELTEKYAAVNGVDSSRTDGLLFYDFALPYFVVKIFAGVSYSTFYLALYRMADKVPSLKEGDTLWFMDLTTPDNIGFSILMALTLLHAMKRVDKEDDTPIGDMAYWNALITVLSFSVLVVCPKVIFCHWITSRLFFLSFLSVMRKPEVQKLLGLPITAPSADKKTKD